MYSMVLMAALTTGTDLPDGRRRGGGGCCGGGCYGGMYYGGYGGCYGGGWGGCYGGGYGGWGGGWGGGYGRGYAWGGYSPMWSGGFAYSPTLYGTTSAPMYGNNAYLGMGNNLNGNLGTMQSFYYNPGMAMGNEARIIVHLPADARLTIDGEATQSISTTRVFVSPPLEQGKTYHYTLRAERRRNNQPETVSKTINVRAGQTTEETLEFHDRNRQSEE